MSIVNAIPKTVVGRVGEKRKHGGFTYQKSINGKWQLLPSSSLKKSIYVEYVVRGNSIRGTAQSLDLTHSFVNNVLKAEGWTCGKAELIRNNKIRFEKNKTKIVKRYEAGDSMQDIAAAFGISNSFAIVALLKEVGIRRTHGEQHCASRKKFAESYAAGSQMVRERAIQRNAVASEFRSHKHYTYCITKLTFLVVNKYRHLVDPKGKQSVDYNIDHQFSKFYGWYEYCEDRERFVKRQTPVPLSVICHPANLKLLHSKVNSAKGNTCHLSLPALRRKIREFEHQHGKVFQ